MNVKTNTHEPAKGLIILAFATVYLLWGSTYLAIHYAVLTIPPFLMAGTRYVVAGSILFFFARIRGAERPKFKHWVATTIIGALLLLGGNGLLVWAEQWIPSGLSALLVATEPLWVAILFWLLPRGKRPNTGVIIGLIAGFTGVILLIGKGNLTSGTQIPIPAIAAALIAAFSWAAGSVYGQRAFLPSGPVLVSGMQMLCGGILMTLTGLMIGEGSKLHPSEVKLVSVIGWLYLIVFGAIIGFTAYSWLLRVASPSRASTHAYVNPAVAVLLGWLIAGEQITPRTIIAMLIILSAVVIITTQSSSRGKSRRLDLDGLSPDNSESLAEI